MAGKSSAYVTNRKLLAKQISKFVFTLSLVPLSAPSAVFYTLRDARQHGSAVEVARLEADLKRLQVGMVHQQYIQGADAGT